MNALLDIPTALTEPEAVALQQLAMRKTVWDVGTLLGFSAIAMGETAEQVVSFDPHEGYPFDNPRDTWVPFNENLVRYRADNVDARRVRLDHREARLAQEDYGAPQFAFIDVDGTYETTFGVLSTVAEHLWVEGIIAVHDYDLPEWPGAGEAVRDWCTQSGARFGIIDTLAIIRPKHPDD